MKEIPKIGIVDIGYNFGIGVFPTSIIIRCTSGNIDNPITAYNLIMQDDIELYKEDIIFYLDVIPNWLEWVTAKMICDGSYISLIGSIKQIQVLNKVPCTSLKIFITDKLSQKDVQSLKLLKTDLDNLIFSTESAEVIQWNLKILMNNDVKLKCYIDMTKVEDKKTIPSTLKNLYPYFGNLI